MINDLRYALRMLLKTPGFSLIAIFALALGIGANTAIFTVVDTVLLRPLPYEAPEQLVRIGGATETAAVGTFSPPDFFDWREQNNSFESIAAYDSASPALTGGAEPERLNGARVSPGFFSVLRVTPTLGRGFLPEEEKRGDHRVAILSNALWQRRFDADPKIVGREINLNGEAFVVVGVMPRGFEPPQFAGFDAAPPDIWIPFAPDLSQWGRDGRSVDAAIGRLKPGVTLAQARVEMETIAENLRRQHPITNANVGIRLVLLQEQLVGRSRPALILFLGAVGVVLLIACANVASMLLARTVARRKEIAIRSALGATRLRITRQLLTESMLLAVAGGACGLLSALWATDMLPALAASALPRIDHIHVSGAVIAYVSFTTIIVGLSLGIMPALEIWRTGLGEKLKEGGRGMSGSPSHRRAQGALIVVEIALSMLLLVAAGLLARSFLNLQHTAPGFDPSNVLTMNIFLPGARYPEPVQQAAFFERAIERVKSLPVVRYAGMTSNLPVSGNYDQLPFYVEGQPLPAPGEAPQTERYMVSQDYFQAMGIPLRAGRLFTSLDNGSAPPVAIVGESTARRFWETENVIGKRIKIGDPKNPWLLVIGVAGDVRHYGLETPASLQVYVPHLQMPSQVMTLVVRCANAAQDQFTAVRNQVWAVDPNQPVYDVKTMLEWLSGSIALHRLNMALVGGFACIALLLAMIGIYGVMSYAVAQRTHEIGVRMALGALRRDIFSLVVGHGMLLTAIGIALGIVGALGVTHLMKSLLFDVGASDSLTFSGVPVALAFVAFLACYVPARRASVINPIEALRTE